MKQLFLICALACVAFAYTALGAAVEYKDLPDWRKQNRCAPFAEALERRCNASGTPAVRLTYDWACASQEGRHVVVLFKSGGQLWLMDNEHLKPWGPVSPVAGDTDLQILKRHASTPVTGMVDNVTLQTNRARSLAELFPQLTTP